MAKVKKKQNFFVAYFKNFGLRQLCDILMLTGAIVIFIGLFTSDNNIVISVGLGIYIVASALAIVRSVRVLLSDINKRAPEYKAATVNTIVMSVIFALAVFGLVYAIFF